MFQMEMDFDMVARNELNLAIYIFQEAVIHNTP